MPDSQIRLTIVVDNNADNGLAAEHGFAAWIESAAGNIIFDTGQGFAFFRNVRELGIDLASAKALILSHGHFDHTGGIPVVLDAAPPIDIYCHPGLMITRYAVRGGLSRSIGVPDEVKKALGEHPQEKKHFITDLTMLSDEIGISGYINRETDFEDTGGPFYLDAHGGKPDLIEDDLAIWIKTDSGLVVCVGCCHAGLVNTMKQVISQSGVSRVKTIIGGLHLVQANDRRLQATVDYLRGLTPEAIYPCHCTGNEAFRYLQDELGEMVKSCYAGLRLSF